MLELRHAENEPEDASASFRQTTRCLGLFFGMTKCRAPNQSLGLALASDILS